MTNNTNFVVHLDDRWDHCLYMKENYHPGALKIHGDISSFYSAIDLGWKGPSNWNAIVDLTKTELEEECVKWQKQQSLEAHNVYEGLTSTPTLPRSHTSKFDKPTPWNALSEANREKLETSIMKLKVGLDISENRIVNRRISSQFISVCII